MNIVTDSHPIDATASVPAIEDSVRAIYRRRFQDSILARRTAVWKILCTDWFSNFVAPTDRVLELGAGYCEFINQIAAREKTAVDINPDTRRYAASDVVVVEADAADLPTVLPAHSFEVAFMSNFLEHCRSRDHLLAILRSLKEVLVPGGRILILGPNFRFSYRDYFDFFDHHLALTDRSVAEALEIAGFHVRIALPRTLPFSFQSGLPSYPWLVRGYLRFPFLRRIFGKQFFIVAVAD